MAMAQIEPRQIQRAVLLVAALLVAACSPEPSAMPSNEIASTAPSAFPSIPLATPAPVAIQPAGTEPWGPFRRTGIDNRAEPDPALTPGATNAAVTQATIGRTICVSGYTTRIRPPESYTEALKSEQIRQYGYSDTRLSDYEEDHLIPLEVGGSPSSARNLWPEPHDARLTDGTKAGSYAKDGLENYLHARVCDGAISLVAAQREVATDWVRYWLAAGKP
jgi:hypothetical protein